MKFSLALFGVLLAVSAPPLHAQATPRDKANRVRTTGDFRSNASRWNALRQKNNNPSGLLQELQQQEQAVQEEEDTLYEMMEILERRQDIMSMPITSSAPTKAATTAPTISTTTMLPSEVPSVAPVAPPPTFSVYLLPSATPSISSVPSASPSETPSISMMPSLFPTPPVTIMRAPSAIPSVAPSATPTGGPTLAPSTSAPTTSPSGKPSGAPSVSPTRSMAPSVAPTLAPTISHAPTNSPTLSDCRMPSGQGMTSDQRMIDILGALDQVANSTLIRNPSTPQGMATQWILNQDPRGLCPSDKKFIQRWTLAVVYYSTGGDDWLQCSAGDVLNCGNFLPFLNQETFLSSFHECEWAGISCNVDACVTEVEFEENNLVGTVPTEMGLLSTLVIWGMEHGNLTGTIPTEIGQLADLIFIDLDYNKLTGSLPTALYRLNNLTQLDLNNNFLTGTIDEAGVGAFGDLEFLQLHANLFTGSIPPAIGTFPNLSTFTLHETQFTGTMPASICNLVAAGNLTSLIADCGGIPTPEIECACCNDCRP